MAAQTRATHSARTNIMNYDTFVLLVIWCKILESMCVIGMQTGRSAGVCARARVHTNALIFKNINTNIITLDSIRLVHTLIVLGVSNGKCM